MSNRKSIRQSLARFSPFSRKRSKPSRIAAAAGGHERPDMLEALEARQMLFTLTVPGAPGTYGVVQEFFSYAIPYLIPTSAIPNAGRVAFLEDFNTAPPADPGPNPNGVNIPSGQSFGQSLLTLDYTAGQLTSARYIREVLATQGANYARFTMQAGESFSFRVAATAQGTPNNNVSRKFSNPFGIQMDIGGQAGANNIDPTTTTIELRLKGVVVSSAALNTFNSVALPGGGRSYTFVAPPNEGFDEIRFVATAAQGPFSVDNVAFSLAPGNFNAAEGARVFGANIVYRGLAGSTIQVLDLYGRDMHSRDAQGNLDLALGDVALRRKVALSLDAHELCHLRRDAACGESNNADAKGSSCQRAGHRSST